MKQNIHNIERIARVALGVGLLSLAFVGPENKWFFLAVIPVVTGVVGWCPLYTVFGISTCSLGKKKSA
jgi:hypothetical protein